MKEKLKLAIPVIFLVLFAGLWVLHIANGGYMR